MRLISKDRYETLVKAEQKVNKAENKVQLKEFKIKRMQKKIDKILDITSKVTRNNKKDELVKSIKQIKDEVSK